MMMKEGKGGKMDIEGNPKTHTVKITVDNNGDFSYVNPFFWARRGDKVVWECTNNYPFAIHIGWNTPFKKGRISSNNGKPIDLTVKDDAQFGDYTYTVVVRIGDVTWTDDPPFIVRPG
jgi:hypothetical protein